MTHREWRQSAPRRGSRASIGPQSCLQTVTGRKRKTDARCPTTVSKGYTQASSAPQRVHSDGPSGLGRFPGDTLAQPCRSSREGTMTDSGIVACGLTRCFQCLPPRGLLNRRYRAVRDCGLFPVIAARNPISIPQHPVNSPSNVSLPLFLVDSNPSNILESVKDRTGRACCGFAQGVRSEPRELRVRSHTQRYVPDSLKLRTARFEHAHRRFAELSHIDDAIKLRPLFVDLGDRARSGVQKCSKTICTDIQWESSSHQHLQIRHLSREVAATCS